MSELEPELSEWEQSAAAALEAADLPAWAYKGRAAIYVQGHRGILDLDLDFPEEYLEKPAPTCYVWKTAIKGGIRVHAYADVDGNRFHLEWDEGPTGKEAMRPQNQPEHKRGPCAVEDCRACRAARLVAELCAQE